MGIQPGTRLGPYEIQAAIGAGGMGEVYKAHDARLNRDVALKVLPEAFSRDAQRMARFEREAKLLASLNHTNIAAIYGLEESGPIRALVMELVEGPTLAERIRGGAIPVDEVLPIARQVADAVEYAHDHNVIHRDLKPANIKVTPDGTVKVLDFGLAKAMSEDVSEGDMANSPTLSMAATQQGVILGTAAYMSPEQAKGKTADRRADVWAFGVVLYEMLTGKQLFSGETVSETMAAVMMKEPSLDALPAKTPSAIRDLLRRCLDRDARQRLRDIGEARILIERVLSGAAPAEPIAAPAVRAPRYRALLIGAGCSLAVGLVAAVVVWTLMRPASQAVTRFPLALPANETFSNTGRHVLAISPDGTRVVHTVGDLSTVFSGLWIQPLDQLEATQISGVENASDLFFSPDGAWIGFYAAGQLRKVAVSGGAPVTLCEAVEPWGASWTADDTILYGQGPAGIWRVAGAGGTPQQVIEVEEGELAYGPQLLPGGDWALFTLRPKGVTSWDQAQIVAQSLTTGERAVLINGGRDARYVSTGHLVYALNGALMAVPFDPRQRRVVGGAVPLGENVSDAGAATGAAQFSISDNGSLVYVPQGILASTGGAVVPTLRTLVWVSRDGREEPLKAPPHRYASPRLSPDGTRVAINIREEGTEIWVWDLTRSTLTRLTFDPTTDGFPIWSPDGRRIAFSSDREGTNNVFWKAADGTGPAEILAEGHGNQAFPTSFSPDGSQILVYGATSGSDPDDNISIVPLKREGAGQNALSELQPLLASSFGEGLGEVSPDGRWLAYQSDESGQPEIYVRPFPDVNGGRWQVSTGGGTEPLWARNGRELFFRSDTAVMAVRVQTESGFSAGNPEVVLRGQYVTGPQGGRSYDVSMNGQRFLMLKEGVSTNSTSALPPQSMVVVQNWFEELKQRVPTGN